jgi:predicted permease
MRLLERVAVWLEGLARDFRYALRTLSRTPTFTVAAILTLGLGIGANTAIFSLIETAMLRSMPIAQPERLFVLFHGTGNGRNPAANYPFFERVRALADIFDGVTTFSSNTLRVDLSGSVELTSGQFVPGNYHTVLGVPMALGRGFTPEDDRAGAGAFVAVISHAYWMQKFGGEPDVLGRTLLVQGQPVSIVGVSAAGFNGLRLGSRADVTVPYAVALQNDPNFLPRHDSISTDMPIVARLKQGITETQALAAVEAVLERYLQEPEAIVWRRWWEQPRPLALIPAAQAENLLRSRFGGPLMVLMAVVGIVLAIGCANVATLVLARASARAKEVAVRLSVGARRSRIVRQLFAESLLLALAGGGLGFLVAGWGARLIAASFSGGEYPLVIDTQPNAVVLLFTSAASLFTVIVFGLYPAYSATRVDVTRALKEGGSEPRRSWWGRKTLVVAQISLSLILVVGAGLLVRSFFNLSAVDVGFDRSNVVLFSLDFEGTDVRRAALPAICDRFVERLRARPGATAASCSVSVPVRGSGSTRSLTIPSLPPAERAAFVNPVTAGYFDTFGVRLLRGRAIEESDSETSPRVAVIDELLARQYFGDTDPLGQTLRFGTREPREPMTIVGVVADLHQEDSLRDPRERTVYTPLAQEYDVPTGLTVAVRSTEPFASLTAAARTETRAVGGDAIVNYVRTMEQQIEGTMARERVLATLSSWFGALALALACLGLYGVVAHDVARRRRDIGIRLALGARPTAVTRETLERAGLLVAAGLAAGLAGAFAAARVLGSLLYGLGPADPVVLGVGVVALTATALAASYLPARRAARISPAEVLRAE